MRHGKVLSVREKHLAAKERLLCGGAALPRLRVRTPLLERAFDAFRVETDKGRLTKKAKHAGAGLIWARAELEQVLAVNSVVSAWGRVVRAAGRQKIFEKFERVAAYCVRKRCTQKMFDNWAGPIKRFHDKERAAMRTWIAHHRQLRKRVFQLWQGTVAKHRLAHSLLSSASAKAVKRTIFQAWFSSACFQQHHKTHERRLLKTLNLVANSHLILSGRRILSPLMKKWFLLSVRNRALRRGEATKRWQLIYRVFFAWRAEWVNAHQERKLDLIKEDYHTKVGGSTREGRTSCWVAGRSHFG